MRSTSSNLFRVGVAYVAGTALAPLLALYLFVGPCAGGRSGLVLAFRGWGVSVGAAWCAKS